MHQWYQIKNKKDNSAEIHIYERIGEDFWGEGVSAKKFIKDLNALDIKNIDLHINSPGGSVFEGNAIYNALVAHKATIKVKIDGIAASIASVIAMSGETIEMPENAMMMIHDPSGMVMGTAEDMLKMAEALEKVKSGIVTTYNSKSGKDRDELADMMKDETWLTAAEAVEHGLADQITERVAMQANFDALSKFKNVPAQLTNTSQSRGNQHEEEIMDLKELKAKFPELFAEIQKASFDEGKQKGEEGLAAAVDTARIEGATAERERVQGVQEQSMPGHEKLIAELMFDGKTTGPEAAVKVLAAEKAAQRTNLDNNADDSPPPLADPDTDGDADVDNNLPLEELCKAKWDKDKGLRAEFNGDYDTYVAYEKAMASGRVRIINKK